MNKGLSGWLASVVALVALVVLGCGGGGGGSATDTATTSTGANDTLTTRLVAQNAAGLFIDPTNLQPGDSCTFEVVTFDLTTSSFTVLKPGQFSTTDVGNQAGTLNVTSGFFTATSPTGGKTYTISSTVAGTPYSAPYGVTGTQAKVTGQIIDGNNAFVPFAEAVFFDSSMTQVGQAAANYQGVFEASVPATATRFNFTPASVPSSVYYQVFAYGSGTYSTLDTGCSAPLPALATGTVVGMPHQSVIADVLGLDGSSQTPPPPPTCSP